MVVYQVVIFLAESSFGLSQRVSYGTRKTEQVTPRSKPVLQYYVEKSAQAEQRMDAVPFG